MAEKVSLTLESKYGLKKIASYLATDFVEFIAFFLTFIPCSMSGTSTSTPKRRQWDPADMAAAMEAVKGGSTVSAATQQFGVPRKTLDDRVKGKVQHGTNPGPPTALTSKEE